MLYPGLESLIDIVVMDRSHQLKFPPQAMRSMRLPVIVQTSFA